MRLNEPLRAYLEEKLKLPVEMVVGANYAATSEALRFGRIDIAYLGPVTYVLQSKHVGLQPFARPSHPGVGPTFQATIIVPANSKAKNLADLKGGDIAFGDPASTSGTWVPRWQLLHEGLVSGATTSSACSAPMTRWRWPSPMARSRPAGCPGRCSTG